MCTLKQLYHQLVFVRRAARVTASTIQCIDGRFVFIILCAHCNNIINSNKWMSAIFSTKIFITIQSECNKIGKCHPSLGKWRWWPKLQCNMISMKEIICPPYISPSSSSSSLSSLLSLLSKYNVIVQLRAIVCVCVSCIYFTHPNQYINTDLNPSFNNSGGFVIRMPERKKNMTTHFINNTDLNRLIFITNDTRINRWNDFEWMGQHEAGSHNMPLVYAFSMDPIVLIISILACVRARSIHIEYFANTHTQEKHRKTERDVERMRMMLMYSYDKTCYWYGMAGLKIGIAIVFQLNEPRYLYHHAIILVVNIIIGLFDTRYWLLAFALLRSPMSYSYLHSSVILKSYRFRILTLAQQQQRRRKNPYGIFYLIRSHWIR